ncbi:AAA family ATPase [Actinomadura violacea]|uniref:AAA family ATPase n=1 Tax=Actinomadura violacea TaxID=2819934 RepID=UPI0027DBF22F|nr:AAA family ATPase [Actinomadura violacea]
MLVVLRGNSGSGKSSVAREVRLRYGHRDLAIVSQDVVRRQILREKDVPGGANIDLLDTIARWSLHRGYHVLLEGILDSGRYGAMLETLVRDHTGPAFMYYLDIPLAETLRRHDTRPQRHEFSAQDMTSWYRAHDLLPGAGETVIKADQSLDATVAQIQEDTGLRTPITGRIP